MTRVRTSPLLALLLAAGSGAAAAAAGDAECLEEFTQEFLETVESPAPFPTENLCFERVTAAGPPAYPASSRRVRLEYRRGDWFAIQEAAQWTFGGFDAARRCTTAVLSRTTITAMQRGAQKQSVRDKDGKRERSADTGVDYGRAIPLGTAPTVVTRAAPGLATRVESTPFGVDCTRTEPGPAAGATLCAVDVPKRCAASRVLLPIEIRIPDPLGGTRSGKTVSLRTGAIVDPSRWVLP